MPVIQIPGSEIWLDPDEITKLEVCADGNHGTVIRIFFRHEESPRVIKFADKEQCIKFYKTVWKLRQSDDVMILEVDDLS